MTEHIYHHTAPLRPEAHPEPRRFPVDRTISLSLIFALAVQTASALYWAGAAEARLSALERQAKLTHPISVRLARLEEQVDAAGDSLIRIEQQLTDVETAHE